MRNRNLDDFIDRLMVGFLLFAMGMLSLILMFVLIVVVSAIFSG